MISDHESSRATVSAAQRALGSGDYRRAHALCLQLLKDFPQHPQALFLLGVIALEHGNIGKAAQLIRAAISADPRDPSFFAQLARCELARQQPRAALEAARSGLALGPGDAYTLDTLGVALVRAGAHAEAVAPFRQAVASKPDNPAYQYNLGTALQFVGDFGASADAYRAVLRIDPVHHRAWSALAQVQSKPFDRDEQAQLEGLLLRPDLSADAELHVCHALAKQREDQGRYDQSFVLLQRGKRRKRAELNYDFEQDRALFEAAQQTTGLHATSPPGHPSQEPIFIVGLPRTGTTLVERILSSHPQVFAAGELTHFALALKRESRSAGPHVLDVATLHAASTLDLAAVGAAYVKSTRPRTGHSARFIDKMPLNLFYAGVIRAALPNARIICLRRNPMDSCLSNFRQLFATGFSYYNYAYDLRDLGRYWLQFDALARTWAEHLGAAYIEVHYEDVVEDIEAQARRLLAFLGLDWHPACIDFHRNAAPVATASSVQVRQPLYRRGLGRWRHYAAELADLKGIIESAGFPVQS